MLLISCKSFIVSLFLQDKLLLYPLVLLLNNIELFTSVLNVFCRNFFAESSVSVANFIIARVLFRNFVINLTAHILFKHVLLGMHLLLLSNLHVVVGFELLFACALKLLNSFIFLLFLERVLKCEHIPHVKLLGPDNFIVPSNSKWFHVIGSCELVSLFDIIPRETGR